MVCCDDKTIGVGTGGDTVDKIHDLCDCLLARHKDFVLRVGLVPPRIDLIVVHIDHLFTGENAAQVCNLEGPNIIEPNTHAVVVILL